METASQCCSRSTLNMRSCDGMAELSLEFSKLNPFAVGSSCWTRGFCLPTRFLDFNSLCSGKVMLSFGPSPIFQKPCSFCLDSYVWHQHFVFNSFKKEIWQCLSVLANLRSDVSDVCCGCCCGGHDHNDLRSLLTALVFCFILKRCLYVHACN